ncbi:hypothetical protein [Haloparvum sp. AD34]
MERRRVLVGAVSAMTLFSGCSDPTRSTYIEIYEVDEPDEPDEPAAIAEYECVRQSETLRTVVDEATETGGVQEEISSTEEEEIRSTLEECYDSEDGDTYLRRGDTLYKINFLQEQ